MPIPVSDTWIFERDYAELFGAQTHLHHPGSEYLMAFVSKLFSATRSNSLSAMIGGRSSAEFDLELQVFACAAAFYRFERVLQ